MRKLNRKNMLKLVGVALVCLGALAGLYQITTLPRVPVPTVWPDDDVVTLRIPTTNPDMSKQAPGSTPGIVTGNELLSVLMGKDWELLQAQDKMLRLTKESARLDQQIEALKQYNTQLQHENAQLQRTNREVQEKMIAFIDRNRMFDTFLSALIGAIVSVAMAYYLELPNVRQRINDYIFKKRDKGV